MIIGSILYLLTVPKNADEDSTFSEAELEVIRYLVEHPEMSHREIAEERDVARGTVNNTVARIRDKTRVALATLIKSPHTREVVEEIEDDNLEQLLSELEEHSS